MSRLASTAPQTVLCQAAWTPFSSQLDHCSCDQLHCGPAYRGCLAICSVLCCANAPQCRHRALRAGAPAARSRATASGAVMGRTALDTGLHAGSC